MHPEDAAEGALKEAKAALRRRLLGSRGALGSAVIEEAGRRVARYVEGCEEFRRARVVALYAATHDEMPTLPVFELARAHEKEVLLPRCLPGGRLEFALVERWEQLREGRFGLLEPEPGRPVAAAREGDLVIVPGVAFDRVGNRLGRGQGYYDRAFPAGAGGPTLFGYAFELQIEAEVPVGPLDRRMDGVASEAGILRPGAA